MEWGPVEWKVLHSYATYTTTRMYGAGFMYTHAIVNVCVLPPQIILMHLHCICACALMDVCVCLSVCHCVCMCDK